MAPPEKSLLVIRDFAPAATGRWVAPVYRAISRILALRAKRLVGRGAADWILLGPQSVVDALGPDGASFHRVVLWEDLRNIARVHRCQRSVWSFFRHQQSPCGKGLVFLLCFVCSGSYFVVPSEG